MQTLHFTYSQIISPYLQHFLVFPTPEQRLKYAGRLFTHTILSTCTHETTVLKAFYAVKSGSTLTTHMEPARSAETLVPISHATTSV